MKKMATAVAVLVSLATMASASMIGADNSSNYTSWTNNSTGGTGFSAWSLSANGNGTESFAGFVLQSSTNGNCGDINVGGTSFGIYANRNDGTTAVAANADRTFSGGALANNQQFSINMSANYRNGARGIDLDIAGTSVFNFNIGGDLYSVNGSDLGWDYAAASEFTLTALQLNSTTLQIDLSRGTDSYSTNLTVASAIDGFGLYVADADQGNESMFYANSMSVQAVPEPVSAALLGIGIGFIYLLRRKMK